MKKNQRSRMAEAIKDFLCAAGLDPSEHPELAQTPAFVAKAWAEEFLDGYASDPKKILAKRFRAGSAGGECGGLVILSGFAFQSVCPHHLLPYGGIAHVAYVPGKQVVGFGQIVKLVDCFAHRLVLQEDLALQIANTLVEELDAKGAGVLLDAQQACLALRGRKRHGARETVEAWAGTMQSDAELRQRFVLSVRGNICCNALPKNMEMESEKRNNRRIRNQNE